jgi:hypothetical protein
MCQNFVFSSYSEILDFDVEIVYNEIKYIITVDESVLTVPN